MGQTHYPCYRAVQRPVFFAGVPINVIGIELIVATIVFKSAGNVLIAGLALILMHSFLRWLFKRDSRLLQNLSAYIGQPDHLSAGRSRNLPAGFGGLY